MRETYTWEFDAPTGIYRCDALTDDLLELSHEPGPILPIYGVIRLPMEVNMTNLHTDRDTVRALVYQARFLRQVTPIEPHLRASIPADYGRTKGVAWYNTAIDKALLCEGARVKEIVPALYL